MRSLPLLAALSLVACGVEDVDIGDGASFTEAQVTLGELRLHDDIESIAYLSWEQHEAALTYVEYSVDEDVWLCSPAVSRAAGEVVEEMLLGIPYDHTFSYRVVNDFGAGPTLSEEASGETGPFPQGMPVPELYDFVPEATLAVDRYVLGSINADQGGWTQGDYWLFIIDRQARIVWAQLTPDRHWTIYARIALSGVDILWEEATWWADWDGGAASQVHRMKIDGTITESYATPGLHHAFTELDDGGLVYGADITGHETLDKRNPDGSYEVIWSTDDIGWGGAQSNTVYWHPATDTFLYSFYSNDSAVEVDHATGETLRQWGNAGGSYAFDPPDSQFWWQHGLNYTDEGNLLLSTRYNNDGYNETLAREYVVDDDNRTLIDVWNFGEGEGIHAGTAGEAHRLDNENTLHNYGSAGRLREVTPDGEVVWDWEFPGERLLGRTVFIEDLYDFAP